MLYGLESGVFNSFLSVLHLAFQCRSFGGEPQVKLLSLYLHLKLKWFVSFL